ncbi:MAG: hypothetical protein V1778_02990 [bacterium]
MTFIGVWVYIIFLVAFSLHLIHFSLAPLFALLISVIAMVIGAIIDCRRLLFGHWVFGFVEMKVPHAISEHQHLQHPRLGGSHASLAWYKFTWSHQTPANIMLGPIIHLYVPGKLWRWGKSQILPEPNDNWLGASPLSPDGMITLFSGQNHSTDPLPLGQAIRTLVEYRGASQWRQERDLMVEHYPKLLSGLWSVQQFIGLLDGRHGTTTGRNRIAARLAKVEDLSVPFDARERVRLLPDHEKLTLERLEHELKVDEMTDPSLAAERH